MALAPTGQGCLLLPSPVNLLTVDEAFLLECVKSKFSTVSIQRSLFIVLT